MVVINGSHNLLKKHIVLKYEIIWTWAEEKRNKSDKMISREYVYNNLQDLRLKNLLSDRNYHIGLRVMSLENYIKSLKNLRSLIDSKYK